MADTAPGVITLAAVRRALAGHQPQPAQAAGARPAAVSLVLVDGPAGAEILMIKRAERAGDPWSGQIAFPGGRQDPEDRDLLATAVRETREETGVDLAAAERLGVLEDLVPRTVTLPPVIVRPFVFAVPRRPALTTNMEVQRAFWVALARLSEPAVQSQLTITLRDGMRTFPAYRLGDDIVWGMTERILTPFVHMISKI
ncbi:MAG TPA: CoA pyrophosphatase [Gemmatimonadales bacterium]